AVARASHVGDRSRVAGLSAGERPLRELSSRRHASFVARRQGPQLPWDDTPYDDASHDDTPHDDTPHDDTPHDDTPHDDTPHDDASRDAYDTRHRGTTRSGRPDPAQ